MMRLGHQSPRDSAILRCEYYHGPRTRNVESRLPRQASKDREQTLVGQLPSSILFERSSKPRLRDHMTMTFLCPSRRCVSSKGARVSNSRLQSRDGGGRARQRLDESRRPGELMACLFLSSSKLMLSAPPGHWHKDAIARGNRRHLQSIDREEGEGLGSEKPAPRGSRTPPACVHFLCILAELGIEYELLVFAPRR